jgi:hypothetical protein
MRCFPLQGINYPPHPTIKLIGIFPFIDGTFPVVEPVVHVDKVSVIYLHKARCAVCSSRLSATHVSHPFKRE